MICSGEQTILLHTINTEDIIAVDKIIASQEQQKNGTLILSPSGVQFSTTAPENDFEFEMRSEKDWIYKEKTGYKNQLFIIGGGHCSLALSALMNPMDFYIRKRF